MKTEPKDLPEPEALPRLVDTSKMAELLGVSISMLEKDRTDPKRKPRFPTVRIGRSVRYNPHAVMAAVQGLSGE